MANRPKWSLALIGIAAAAFTLAAGRDFAQNNEATVQFHSFQDVRGVTVLTPTVDLEQDYTERTSLRINYGLDAISAASDSCVRCHRDGVNSHRQVVGLSATRKYDDWKVTVGGAFSKENFYRATTGLVSASRDLANANTTVAGGFTLSLNQPMLHPLPESENQYQSGAFASLTQTLTRTTIAQVGYEFAHISGYQNNPYLRADLNGVLMLGNVPDLRIRHTLSARLRQALPAATYLEADYRRYMDDWQVVSNTLSVGLSHYFRPEFLLAFNYRRYDQTGAYFWAPRVHRDPAVLHRRFPARTVRVQELHGPRRVRAVAGVARLPEGTALTVEYERYRADNGFSAAIVSSGLRVPIKVFKR